MNQNVVYVLHENLRASKAICLMVLIIVFVFVFICCIFFSGFNHTKHAERQIPYHYAMALVVEHAESYSENHMNLFVDAVAKGRLDLADEIELVAAIGHVPMDEVRVCLGKNDFL